MIKGEDVAYRGGDADAMSRSGGSGGPHPPLRGTLRLASLLRQALLPPRGKEAVAYQRPLGRDALNDVGRVLNPSAA